MPVVSLTLYGRAWCHLCDDMRAELDELIRALGSNGAIADIAAVVEAVDIDADPSLEARYNERVPLLVLDGIELCHHRLDQQRVAAALLARQGDAGRQIPPDGGLFR